LDPHHPTVVAISLVKLVNCAGISNAPHAAVPRNSPAKTCALVGSTAGGASDVRGITQR